MNRKTILVTGGAGYIGSHACVELLDSGYDVVIVDNLSNSQPEAVRRIEKISGQSVAFYQADVRDKSALTRIFEDNAIDAVIHFAGLKAVGESCRKPVDYYHNNIVSTLVLVDVMAQFVVRHLVFSSSATVYGDPASVPITEDFPLQATNPYGRTKLFIEEILRDLSAADALNRTDKPWKIALLRYFNPVGAHHSGLIGESPDGIPNNLMPYLSQVAIGKLEKLSVFGDDYDTRDGTGVRDYIHVVDLAQGHVKALDYLLESNTGGLCEAFNLGTGQGHSVLEMIDTFQKATGQPVNYQIVDRRPGDIAQCYANTELAQSKLGWRAQKSLQDMMADTWRWQSLNPDGYSE